jgi:hypothetical protein
MIDPRGDYFVEFLMKRAEDVGIGGPEDGRYAMIFLRKPVAKWR